MFAIEFSRRCALPRNALKPLAAAIAIALPAISFAQTADTNNTQSVVVTASRNAQAPRDVLSDNSVITADQIERSGQTSLVALLQQQRGVEITTTGGAGSSSSVFLRGTNNAQTLVLVDGVRIGSSTNGGATWENIPLAQVDHIEIVYGPLSSLYGADALGGVVQIFTKQGDGAPHPSVMVGFGSYNERALEASVGGSTTGANKFHYALDVARDESDGFPATTPAIGPYSYNTSKDGYNKESASGQFSYDWSKGHTVGIDFLQSKNPAGFDQSPLYVDHSIERLNTFSLYSRDQLTATWSSLAQLSQSEDKGLSTNLPSAATNVYKTKQNEYSWQNDFVLGTDLLQIIVGRREEKVDTNEAFGGERDTNSVAGSYQWKSGNQLAVFSLRDDDSSQYGKQVTGGIAYGYRLTNTLRANASYGTSFRAPTFDDLYYPGFGIANDQPEHGKNAETGLYYDDGKSQFSAAYYHNKITDLLEIAPVCPVEQASHPYGCTYNIDHALLSGLTMGGRTKFGNYSLHGSIDFQNPVDQTTDTILARRARRHGDLGLDYQAGQWNAGADILFSSSRTDTDFNTGNKVTMGGYGLLNVHAEYEFVKDWTLFGRWNNVLNKSYDLAYGYATPGSNAFVGLRYGFK